MCRCTPSLRTPFCGKPGCGAPEHSASTTMSSQAMEAEHVAKSGVDRRWAVEQAMSLGLTDVHAIFELASALLNYMNGAPTPAGGRIAELERENAQLRVDIEVARKGLSCAVTAVRAGNDLQRRVESELRAASETVAGMSK